MTYKTEHSLEIQEVSINFRVLGIDSGVPLFILHGGPGFDHTYLLVSSVWEDLGRNRPVILYDQRGTGRSSPVGSGNSCTLADQLSDLEALRKHLDYNQMDLLGHSWGGFLGMAYTARYPKQVRRLVLVGSAAPRLQDGICLFEHIFPETTERQKAVAFAQSLGDKDAIRRFTRDYLSMLFYSPEKRDTFLEKVDPANFRPHIAEALSRDAGRFDLNPELPKFHQATLVTSGRYDINVAPSVAYHIFRLVPNAQFEIFEQSGHLPFYEEPVKFANVVERFLIEN